MKKFLLPIMSLAMMLLPAAAHAAQCRNTDTGKFAKCGSPGAVPASQYVAKTKSKPKTAAKTMTAPAATPTKSGFMAMMKPKAKPTPTPTATAPMAKAKAVRCKDAKSKFVKCGTPGAKPV